MINYLVKTLINKYMPRPERRRYAEDIINGSYESINYRPNVSSVRARDYSSDAAVLSVPQSEIYDTMYFECRDLFKVNLQQSRLRREQLIYIDNLLDEELGEKKRYYNQKYNNICHSIYSKLKSSFLDNSSYQRIIEAINLFTQ